jgi:aryl-alcohol dehydrogenase-like predicted oxidoreductase
LLPNPSDPHADPSRDLSAASIRRELEASLRRLGVEQIDLYQIHWPDKSGASSREGWEEMARFVEEGKVRAIGVSNFSTEQLEEIDAVRHVDSLQPPFSMIRRDAAADVIPWAARNQTGVIVYSPLQSGILTDSFSRERVAALSTDDWRRRSAQFQEPALGKNIALRDALVPIARRHDVSVSAIAIAWTLAVPGVTGAIVGARSPEQLKAWIGAGHVQLTADDQVAIAQALP